MTRKFSILALGFALLLPAAILASDIGKPNPEALERLVPRQGLLTVRPALLSEQCVLG